MARIKHPNSFPLLTRRLAEVILKGSYDGETIRFTGTASRVRSIRSSIYHYRTAVRHFIYRQKLSGADVALQEQLVRIRGALELVTLSIDESPTPPCALVITYPGSTDHPDFDLLSQLDEIEDNIEVPEGLEEVDESHASLVESLPESGEEGVANGLGLGSSAPVELLNEEELEQVDSVMASFGMLPRKR